MGQRGYQPKYGEKLDYKVYCLLTESQHQDLKKLAMARGETQAEALRSCFLAVVNRAKKKGVWKED